MTAPSNARAGRDIVAELRDCPFCGQFKPLRLDRDDDGWWRVECDGCAATGPGACTEADGAQHWNGVFPEQPRLGAPSVGGWQPIETAPRGGWLYRFLAADDLGWVFVCHWSGECWLGDTMDIPDHAPVAWMPLPAPPEVTP